MEKCHCGVCSKCLNEGKAKDGALKPEEVTDLDLEVIAEQIKDGMTSGIFNDETCRIAWEIKINKWKE